MTKKQKIIIYITYFFCLIPLFMSGISLGIGIQKKENFIYLLSVVLLRFIGTICLLIQTKQLEQDFIEENKRGLHK